MTSLQITALLCDAIAQQDSPSCGPSIAVDHTAVLRRLVAALPATSELATTAASLCAMLGGGSQDGEALEDALKNLVLHATAEVCAACCAHFITQGHAGAACKGILQAVQRFGAGACDPILSTLRLCRVRPAVTCGSPGCILVVRLCRSRALHASPSTEAQFRVAYNRHGHVVDVGEAMQLERAADEAAVCELAQSAEFQAALASSPGEQRIFCAALLARAQALMQGDGSSDARLAQVLSACVMCAPPAMLTAVHHCRAVAELQKGELEHAWEAVQKAVDCIALPVASRTEHANAAHTTQDKQLLAVTEVQDDKLACLTLQIKIAMQVRFCFGAGA